MPRLLARGDAVMGSTDRNAFLEERRTGLGGSDIGAILGLSKYRTPVEVWMEKTGRAVPKDGTLQMRFGTYAEQFVADEYSASTGRLVQRFNPMLRHPDFPMVIGHVDRLVIPDGQKRAAHQREIRTDRLLECKTASAFAASGGEWGPSGTDEVPAGYLIQIATYCALTGCAYADLAALFGNQELRIYTLTRDIDLEQELLRRAAEWWRQHVENDLAPDPQSEADVRLLYPKDNQREIEATDEIYDAWAQLSNAKRDAKELESTEQSARDVLTAYMGESAVLRYRGETLATYKASRDGSKTDWKAVAQAMKAPAELISKHTIQTAGSRRLLIK